MALQNSTSSRALARYPGYRVIAAVLAGLVGVLLVLSSNASLHQALHSQVVSLGTVHGLNAGNLAHRCAHHHGDRSSTNPAENSGAATTIPEVPPIDHQEGCALCLFASAVIADGRWPMPSTIPSQTWVLLEWSLSFTDPLTASEAPPSERGPPIRESFTA